MIKKENIFKTLFEFMHMKLAVFWNLITALKNKPKKIFFKPLLPQSTWVKVSSLPFFMELMQNS